MTLPFALLDWIVVGAYILVLIAGGMIFTPRKTQDARDYFLASGQVPPWLAAISVLSATQSAATFLGGPDYGYRGDYTYLSGNIGGLMGAIFVARVLIPRFYALGATTVYELLDGRFGRPAMRAAGGMFLIGRVLAGGARVYLAAIAISMVMFSNISPQGIFLASAGVLFASFAFTFVGGLKSILWNDLIQFLIYVGAALAILLFLWSSIPASTGEILHALASTPEGSNKLRLINFSTDLSEPFSILAIMTGVFLLYIANSGLDQDTTQRLLACKDARDGARGLYISVLATIPVIWIFISIGLLLYIFYERPDLMQRGTMAGGAPSFKGEEITVFMRYILTELPAGLRGLVTIGVIAAAVATTNSALNAMSSVLVQDFYRPWRATRGPVDERHFVQAGRVGMGLMGLAMFAMAVLSFYWQRYSSMPLLEFALAVMTFAYAGLLGVYFTALFTKRGSSRSVYAALIAGFVTIFMLQPYIAGFVGLPAGLRGLSFPWQLCIGTAISTLVCLAGSPVKAAGTHETPAAPALPHAAAVAD
ncbi:sodium:solute symporter [Sphingomonas oleivorans]|uniref:Sodium:solute symporter n=1 Tax=Sphingomonas oleivorans TaxID=1735121 RepID=A0A2T5FUN0_9SPHN|nr:sodium:solute symporter [Sphingomonas oleivorans]PTQ08227.1 sodium:solute symporter [Sphingomonas oleivorans]